MEMEAVVEERASLETQLASLRTQIDSLTSEVEEHKSKVNLFLFFFFVMKVRFFKNRKKKIQRNS
jgi:chromosome segregation ATPase